jgi:heme exporter protein A
VAKHRKLKLVTDSPALELTGLVHRYARSYVLRGANLQLARGEVLAMYGSNGAGKTTLLKIMATALSPSRGKGKILGFALNDQQRIRGKVLLVSHNLGLYQELSGLENLEFSASMSLKNVTRAKLQIALERVGMGGVTARVRAYSSGMRKRLALAKMLILEPELVLLDEPFAALDPEGKNLVEDLLTLERQRGTTLVIASHEPERTAKISSLETTLQDGLLSEPTVPRLA